ncbi:MAG TPA: A24 family peptidase [Acetobacteraceae bacterium]|nr:A24 family peptidase [Acetobacteraceae bacterium]
MAQNVAPLLAPPLLIASVAVLLAAALHDVAARTVPNWMPLALAGLGATLRLASGQLPQALAVSGAVFVVATLCWRCGFLGGGDVKLLGAGALVVPPGAVGGFLLLTSLAGGVLALGYLALAPLLPHPATARPALLAARVLRAEQYRIRRRFPLPYAVAIAAGALTLLLLRG